MVGVCFPMLSGTNYMQSSFQQSSNIQCETALFSSSDQCLSRMASLECWVTAGHMLSKAWQRTTWPNSWDIRATNVGYCQNFPITLFVSSESVSNKLSALIHIASNGETSTVGRNKSWGFREFICCPAKPLYPGDVSGLESQQKLGETTRQHPDPPSSQGSSRYYHYHPKGPVHL